MKRNSESSYRCNVCYFYRFVNIPCHWVQELEKLAQQFEENILDATNKFEKLITDKKDIEGMTATGLAMAAQMAVSKVYCVKILACIVTTCTLPSHFSHFFVLLYASYSWESRVTKMQLLKMVHGLSHWLVQAIVQSCNMQRIVLYVKNYTVLMSLVLQLEFLTIQKSSITFWSLGWRRQSFLDSIITLR